MLKNYDNPEPVETPYQKARQAWDERLGTVRVQNLQLRNLCYVMGVIVLVCLGMVGWMSNRATITPYIVEVGDKGVIKVGAVALESDFVPSDGLERWFIEQYIKDIRSISLDPTVTRDNWIQAFSMSSAEITGVLEAISNQLKPFERKGERVVVDLEIITKDAGRYRVDWIETTYDQKVIKDVSAYSGYFSIIQSTPKNEGQIRENPLGLFVTSLDISKNQTRSEQLNKSKIKNEGSK